MPFVINEMGNCKYAQSWNLIVHSGDWFVGAEVREKRWGQRWLNVARNALPEQANEAAVYDPLQLCHLLNGNKMTQGATHTHTW